MAEIEIGPLTDRLSDEEIAELAKRMEKLGAPQLPRGDSTDTATLGDDIDDDALTEFFDKLDAHDLAAEVYLPIEFDGVVEVGGLRVASAQALLDVLEEVKSELDVDEEELDEDDEDYEEASHLGEELKHLWRLFTDGAQASMDRKLPLHIKS